MQRNMTYIDMVNEAQHDAHSTGPVPAASLEYALGLKQPGVMAQLEDQVPMPPEFAHLRTEHQSILKTRKIGNQLVRFAVASQLATQVDGRLMTLQDMHPEERATVFGQALHLDVDGNLPEIHLTNDEIIHRVSEAKLNALNAEERAQFKLAYANVIPGSFPSRFWHQSPFANNDVTLTQAFGRNTITDAELPEMVVEKRTQYRTDEETFRALLAEDFDPGESNYALADTIAIQLQDPTVNIEQVMQWEPGYALWEVYPELFHANRPAIHIVWPTSDFYPTHEVKADSVAVMKRIGLFNPYEFAHPDMMIRATGILGKLGVQADVLARDIPFDEASAQPWTRGAAAWTPREFAARAEHVLRRRVAFPKKVKQNPDTHGH